MSKQIQNFFKSTLSLDWSIGTGTFYVTTKPTITDGWLVISPNNATIREIIKYTSTGTDSNGDYIVISERGVGGTSEQTHTVGEPIRMNVTAEYWKYMGDAIDSIVAAGVPNADTTTMGGVEIATDAEVIAGTNTGSTGASLVATPGQINLKASKFTKTTVITSNGTFTKDADSKIIKVIAFGSGGNGSTGGANSTSRSAGGGGGGAKVEKDFIASEISSPVTVTVATPGTTPTSFGTYLYAYNGGNGGAGNSNDGTGGTGGGNGGNGANGSSTGTILGGLPALVAGAAGISGQGAGAGTGSGRSAEFGGASGGGYSTGVGGSSLYGAGGGGGAENGTSTGGAGGKSGTYTAGGGGAGGAGTTGGAGIAGTSRSGTGLAGDGGGAGGGHTTGQAGAGGNGGVPGGGGGGGGSASSSGTGGAGGTGGRGEVIVIEYF